MERDERLAGFDERFFLTWEDVDLSLRVSMLGLLVAIVPSARVYHKVSRSFDKQPSIGGYYHVRNSLLLVRLHVMRCRARVNARIIMAYLRNELRLRREGQPGNLHAIIGGVYDHVMRRYGRCRR